MNIIVLGQAGSGKGTQAEILAQKFEADHFDAGKLLRQVAKMGGKLGQEIHNIINVKRELVPSRILKEIVHLRISDMPREQGIIFDGVPRNLEQAQYFSEALQSFGRKIDAVFFINIPAEESIRRISSRRICEDCKKILIMGQDVQNESEVCPVCGGKIMHRLDDTVVGVKKRLQVFNEETMPVIDFYKEQNILIDINGVQDIQKVAEDMAGSLEKI